VEEVHGAVGEAPGRWRVIRVFNIRVRTLSLRSLQVSWEVVPTPEEVLDYRFQVLRSESTGGPYDAQTDWLVDRYLFLDDKVDPFNTHRVLYYKIRVKHLPTSEVEEFGPGYLAEEPDRITLEVRRHWEVETHELTGRRGWIFPVRTFGSTCAECYDKGTQRVTISRCLSCFSTGFVRGYLHPIEVNLKTGPVQKAFEPGVTVQQKGATRFLLPAQPDVKPKDLIVLADSNRYLVASVDAPHRLGAVLHQSIVVTECEPGAIEYEVPVNLDQLMSADLAAPRNYRYRTTVG